jgi:hypothetical protein
VVGLASSHFEDSAVQLKGLGHVIEFKLFLIKINSDVDPDSLNLDPDPAFQVNPDPDPVF